MDHQEPEVTDKKASTHTLTDIPLLNLGLAMILAPISGFITV
jgi:hypothetical protein